MTEYHFSVIVRSGQLTDEQALDAADSLAAAGCDDASVRGHQEGMEVLFDRGADTLQEAIQSAVSDVESAGYQVARIQLEREALPG